jgi:3-oxoacyl-[acyl-carrier protein] reductase
VDIAPYFSLDGKVAVVTGAASGIGAATAEVLAGAGAAVVLGDIDEAGAQATADKVAADGGRAVVRRTDTSRKADVEALVDLAVSEFGRLDVMGNIAGVGYAKPVEAITEADFDRLMGINLKGVLWGCQAALRVMAPQGEGVIVNVASTAVDTPFPGQALYGMTKAGVVFLTQVLAAEAGPQGIRVNVIAPGSTVTNFGAYRYEGGPIDHDKEAEFQERMRQLAPLRLSGEAMDQALLVLYLASPASRWATGNLWRVNGGVSRPW